MKRDSDQECLALIRHVRLMGVSAGQYNFSRITDNLELRVEENARLRVLFARIRKDAEEELNADPGIVFDGFKDGYRRYAKDILDAISEVELIEGNA